MVMLVERLTSGRCCAGRSRRTRHRPPVGELKDHPGLGKHLRLTDRDIHVWTVNTAQELQICLDSMSPR